MSDRIKSKKIPDWANRANTSAAKLDPGPYIGIVKNNFDNTRSGRLQVWIPDLGGDENNPRFWYAVSYVSPYMGMTFQPDASKNNKFTQVQHSYGMWAVPPDIGNEVIVTFVGGYADRGYWFGVTSSNLSRYMIPGIGSSPDVDKDNASDDLKKTFTDGQVYPLAEFNENDPNKVIPNFIDNKKPIHEVQFLKLLRQGLDRDPVRGAVTSSSQRESPSRVFGISTPGRPLKEPSQSADFEKKLQDGNIKEDDIAVRGRKGGHTFIMDDGDFNDVNRIVRLRSSDGHQILMNDTEGIMYIANEAGSVWVELARNGSLHIYSAGGVNIRSQGDFNVYSDKNINLHANKSVNLYGKEKLSAEAPNITISASENATLYAGTKMGIGSAGALNISNDGSGAWTSGGTLNLTGSPINLNSGSGDAVEKPAAMTLYESPDANYDSGTKLWKNEGPKINAIMAIVPTHEPWDRKTGKPKGTPIQKYSAAQDSQAANAPVNQGEAPVSTAKIEDCSPLTQPVTSGSGAPVTTGSGGFLTSSRYLDAGIESARGKPVSNPCPKNWLDTPFAPNPPGGVGPLDQNQVKCLMAQIAFNESRWQYAIKNQLNYIGRYQFGAAACTDAGYIKLEFFKQYGNRAFNYPDAWTGKNGCTSIESWFSSKGIQETEMYRLLSSNYKTLVRIGGIKSNDTACEVGGMLQVAHLLGAGGAKSWRNSASGADANGTTGEQYFNRGRYAIEVLAKGGGATATPPTIA